MRIVYLFSVVLLLFLSISPAWAACTGPVGIQGDIIYNQDYNTPQFCNGTNWIRMDPAINESDPEVGDVGTLNNICRADGAKVVCDIFTGDDRRIFFSSGGLFTSSAGFLFTSTGRLFVPRSVKIGDDTGACSVNIGGAIRYRSGIGVEYCDGSAWRTVAATGTGVILSISPPTKTDMDVTGCGTPPCQGATVTFTVTNKGDQLSNVLTYTLDNTTNFNVIGDTCTGNTLGQNATCQIDIQPETSGDGLFSATLTIPQHNAPSAVLQGLGSGFTCATGQTGFGGIVVQCDYAGPGKHLIAMQSGCDGTLNEPACSGGDTYTRTYAQNDFTTNLMGANVQTTDGAQNTVNMLALSSSPAADLPAAYYCDQLVHNGETDWFLPSFTEFNTQLAPANAALTLSGNDYWTSNEYDAANASCNDGDGSICNGAFSRNWDPKTYGKRVRCTRVEGVALPAPQTDDTPNSLIFATKFATAAAQNIQSDTLSITGITPNIAISIAGDPSAQYSINGGAFTSAAGTVSEGDTVAIQANSPAPGTRLQLDLTIGSATFNWSIITEGDCGGGGCAGVDKRVFATSTTYRGNLGGVIGADAKCQTQADAATLGGTWRAIISQPVAANWAANRIDYNWDRLVDINGTVIATSPSDLWDGTIASPINIDENGVVQTGNVWTSSTSFGASISENTTVGDNCSNWTDGLSDSSGLKAGAISAVNSTWISGVNGRCWSDFNRLYCAEVNAPTVNLVLTPTTQSGMDVVGPGNPALGAPVTFTLQNQGTGTSAVLTASLSSSANFDILNDLCTGNPLASLASCTLDVRPKAFADGSYNSTLTVSDGTASDNSGLSGTASGFANAVGIWLKGTADDIYYNSGANPQVGIGTAAPRAELDIAGTGAAVLPVGDDSQRPGTPASGMIRFSSQSNIFEGYNGTTWSGFLAGAPGGDREMIFNSGGNLFTSAGLIYTSAGLFDVGGGLLRAIDDTAACDSAVRGAQRFNSASAVMELCDGTNWLAVNTGSGGKWLDGIEAGEIYYTSRVGVINTNPDATLDITGILRAADESIACNTTLRGSIRFNSTLGDMQICDGTDWAKIVATTNLATLIITPAVVSTMDITGSGSPAFGSYVTFTVQNAGSVDSQSIVTALSNPTNFEFGTDNCNGNVLTPSAICTIQVRPKAFGDGAYSGTLNIIADNSPQAIMSGTATGSCGVIGSTTDGGKLAACFATYKLIVMDGGCDGTLTNPDCTAGTDSYTRQWATNQSTFLGLSSTTDGPGNTQIMVTSAPPPNHPAADYCNGLTLNGFTDWYLPALDELELQVFPVAALIGEWSAANSYWLSTESSASPTADAKRINMSTGGVADWDSQTDKVDTHLVRCLRRTTSVAGANLAWSPSGSDTMDINSVGNPAFGTPVTFTLNNNGGATSAVIALSLSNTTNFEIVGGADNCSGNTLAASTSCTVDVRAKATYDFTYSGNLQATVENNPVASLSGTSTGTCGTIGSSAGGGVIAHCANGYRLIATPGGCNDSAAPTCPGVSDALLKQWATENVDINAVSTTDGQNAGAGNTATIMARVAATAPGTYPVGEFCANMTYGGFSDWYLPASSELSNNIYPNKVAIGGLGSNKYWSSTEIRAGDSVHVRMSDGFADFNGSNAGNEKNLSLYVRCVRRDTGAIPANLVLSPTLSTGMDVVGPANPAFGPTVTFTLQNTGGATSGVIATSLTNSTNFEITSDTCNGFTLAGAASCAIDVRSKATGNGPFSGQLQITANNNPVANLTGTAIGFTGDSATWLIGVDPGDIYYSSGPVGIGTSDPDVSLEILGTDAILIPRGDTGQRPGGVNGMLRYNSQSGTFEGYQAGTWQDLITTAATPGAPDRGIQFNSGGVFTADANFVFTSAGRVGIGTSVPDVALYVSGSIKYTGTIMDVSDIRLKTDITPLESETVLDRLWQIDTYSFRMKSNPDQLELGVIAQEVEKIFPELVQTGDDEMGTKSVNYVGFIAPLIEAVNAQQAQLEDLQAENDGLRAELRDLVEAQIESINAAREDVRGALATVRDLAAERLEIKDEIRALKEYTRYEDDRMRSAWAALAIIGVSLLILAIGWRVRRR